jgi:archaellum biogenesis ATPase FlaH
MAEDQFEEPAAENAGPISAQPAEKERARPLIDWGPEFEVALAREVVAGTVLGDFPDLLDADLWGTGDSGLRLVVQAALDYHKRHKQAPGFENLRHALASSRKSKALAPMALEALAEVQASDPADYPAMRPHLGPRCLYRASRQKAIAEAEWLSRGAFETIEEFGAAQEALRERVERIERAGSVKVPFSWTRASEFEAPPVEWLIEGLVPAGMLSMVAGKDGLGKSLLTMQVTKSTLTGSHLLGRFKVNKTGPVLLLAMDDPDSLISDRLIVMGIKDHPDLFVPQGIDHSNPIALLRHALRTAAEHKPALIVVDCLYRLIPEKQGSNNDAALMVPLLNLLNTLAETTGAAVIVIHHENKKGGGDIAGSFAIRASLKVLIKLSKPRPARGKDGEEDEVDESVRVMRLDKSKLTPEREWMVRNNGAEAWDIVDQDDARKDLLADRILEAVRDHPGGIPLKQLALVMGYLDNGSKKTLSNRVATMVKVGVLEAARVKVKGPSGVAFPVECLFETGKSPSPKPTNREAAKAFYRRPGSAPAAQIAP